LAIWLPAAMIALTWSGALAGAIARPSGPICAWSPAASCVGCVPAPGSD